jgi:hypothetical protein
MTWRLEATPDALRARIRAAHVRCDVLQPQRAAQRRANSALSSAQGACACTGNGRGRAALSVPRAACGTAGVTLWTPGVARAC